LKHITRISKHRPEKGAAWQDGICFFAMSIAEFLSFLGGSSPILNYISDKCTIPQPNNPN
jgi:hypothetical protein